MPLCRTINSYGFGRFHRSDSGDGFVKSIICGGEAKLDRVVLTRNYARSPRLVCLHLTHTIFTHPEMRFTLLNGVAGDKVGLMGGSVRLRVKLL